MDTEFTDLDASQEVSSPTMSSSRKTFIEKIGILPKSSKKAKPVAQDPTFKDFNYFCEDPDSLVEVQALCGELRAPLTKADSMSPKVPQPSGSGGDSHDGVSIGTPLASFVQNGQLHYPSSPQPVAALSPTGADDMLTQVVAQLEEAGVQEKTMNEQHVPPDSAAREQSSHSVTL